MSGGRPTQCTPEVIAKAREYVSEDPRVNFESYDHAIPSVVGLTRVLNVARSSIYKWAEDKENAFSDILENINEYQEFTVINKTLRNEYNANIGKLVLGKHGYHDKQDQNVGGQKDNPVESKWTVEFINATPPSKSEA